jgi:hypothetical protein
MTEKCKRMIDLFLVSVLLDAGAGTEWSYRSAENGRVYRRSEGIAVATLDMFKAVSRSPFASRPPNHLLRALTRTLGALFQQQDQQVPGRQGCPAGVDCGATCPRAAVQAGE